jgi:hypothetical protein
MQLHGVRRTSFLHERREVLKEMVGYLLLK